MCVTMMKRGKKWRKIFLVAIVIIGALFLWRHFFIATSHELFSPASKNITLTDGGYDFSFAQVPAETVGEFLKGEKLEPRDGDRIFPDVDTPLFSGTHIIVFRAHEIAVRVDGENKKFRVQGTTVAQALAEVGVTLDPDDIVKPLREMALSSGLAITVTRVDIREESVDKAIAFETKENEDDTLSWRKKVVTTKGEKGIKRLTYRVSAYDGKEVKRTLLQTEVVQAPVTEIVTQGTYVKLGKSHTGGASWYAWTGTMAAANPWLPKGSFVKVTNLDNGKNVIVVINDRGPFVPGRIIDLDKVAFQKIASIGAGVINVKMEEIIN